MFLFFLPRVDTVASGWQRGQRRLYHFKYTNVTCSAKEPLRYVSVLVDRRCHIKGFSPGDR